MAVMRPHVSSGIRLRDDRYQTILHSESPVAKTVIDAYRHWIERPGHPRDKRWDINDSSTILFDTAAIYLAMSTDLFEMESLGIFVDKWGRTVIDEDAKEIDCALERKNLDVFYDFLITRLTQN